MEEMGVGIVNWHLTKLTLTTVSCIQPPTMVIHLEKKPSSKAVPPLTARPLDLLYAIFFAVSTPSSPFNPSTYIYI